MDYDTTTADAFWTRRVRNTDELEAVLHYGVPRAVNEAYSKWELTCVLDNLPDVKNRRVLDLACGNGRDTVPLARRSARVTAVDNAGGMVDACRRNVVAAGLSDRVEWTHASATNLPFPDDEFDVSLCLGLLEHLPDEARRAALGELVRVTRDDGTMLLTVNNDRSVFLQQSAHRRHDEQFRSGELAGFYAGLVGLETVESFLRRKGMATEVVGANAFQAFAMHMRNQEAPREDDTHAWRTLFDVCAELDMRSAGDGKMVGMFAEQFIVRAVKAQGRP